MRNVGVLNIPHTRMMISLHGTEHEKFGGAEHPPWSSKFPNIFLISPTAVKKSPYGTQDMPPQY